MVNFVIEIAAHDDPPEAHLTPESRIEDFFIELILRQAFKQDASLRAGANQRIEQRQILCLVGDLDDAGVPDDGIERLHLHFFEEPLVCIDQVLRQVGEAHRTGRKPPIFLPYRHLPQPLQRRFPNGAGEGGQSFGFACLGVHVFMCLG